MGMLSNQKKKSKISKYKNLYLKESKTHFFGDFIVLAISQTYESIKIEE